MKAIFKSIQSICDEARRALDDPELPRDDLLSALSVRVNEGRVADPLSIADRYISFHSHIHFHVSAPRPS